MSQHLIDQFRSFIHQETYPCVGAKGALAKHQLDCMVAGDMASGSEDQPILFFIYDFIDRYRKAGGLYHSAAIIFQQPTMITEPAFDTLMWKRLQALHDLDAVSFAYDTRVQSDPNAASFSFSLGKEAFFLIGMHPGSGRASRRFDHPAIVFNPHEQFVQLKTDNHYQRLQQIIRKRDNVYSGSVNPMLEDFGEHTEARQYSGQRYDETWRCPLIIHHGRS